MGSGNSGLNESDQKPLGGGGRGSGINPVTVYPFKTSPQDLKETLGTKGRNIGVVKALEGANPFYSGGTDGDFTENCQRAVIAYEARRRGYDVVALPTYEGDTLPSGSKWRGAFMHGKTVNVGSTNPKTAQANLEKEMKSYGNGARGIVTIPGHAFNVENVNGKIRYVDAQTNTVYNSNNVFSRLGRTASQVTLMRTDNLRFSDRAKKSVTPTTDTTRMIVVRRKNKR